MKQRLRGCDAPSQQGDGDASSPLFWAGNKLPYRAARRRGYPAGDGGVAATAFAATAWPA